MTELKQTPLVERHRQLGARMVEFAGWYMPVQYKGIIVEHQTVRAIAGLFDLGHMGQVEVRGRDALAFLQYVTPNDVARLQPGEAQYSMLLYPNGGVVDDILVYARPSGAGYFVVVNAANTEKDVAWLCEQRARRSDLEVDITDVSDRTGMLAIQGPKAEVILQRLTRANLLEVEYFHAIDTDVAGVPAMVARTGYTGEDGFELYCPIEQVVALWDRLLETGAPDGMLPIGLGARDTLRLEACLPLYGNELSPEITPLEAGLGWVVKLDKGDFIGREALLRQKSEGIPRKLVGFKLVERGGVPRSHCEVRAEGKTVGFVTSGTTSPTLRENVGLALIAQQYAGIGRPLDIVIRGRPVRAEQVKTPFYKRTRSST